MARKNHEELSLKPQPDDPLEALRSVLQSMRYGAVTVVVHDSRIVQMEVTEKKRFAA